MRTQGRFVLMLLACLAGAAIAAASTQPAPFPKPHEAAPAPGAVHALPAAPGSMELSPGTTINPWAKLAAATGYSLAAFEKETAGSGLAFAGYTSSYGTQGMDFWLFNLDSGGALVSSKLYGGAAHDTGLAIPTSDGGYLASGVTKNGTSAVSYWAVKLDSAGTVQWQTTFPPSIQLIALNVELSDGYLFAGNNFDLNTFTYTSYLVKLDLSGNLVWKKGYSLESPDLLIAFQVQEASGGGLLVSGTVTNSGTMESDLFLMKLGTDGTPAWAKRYGGMANEIIGTTLQLAGGNILLQGSTMSYGAGGTANGTGDAWVLKLDSSGEIVWQTAYGGAGDEQVYAQADPSGGFLLSGQTTSFGAGGEDVWAFRLNDSGGIVWQKAYGGAVNETGFVRPDSAGGYLLSGTTDSFGAGNDDAWVAKLDGTGGIVWQKTYGTTQSDEGFGSRLSTGEILVVGAQATPETPSRSDQDVWIVRANSTGDLGSACSFIATGTGAAVTTAATVTPSTATPALLTVTTVTPSLTVSAGTFTTVSAPFSTTDICLYVPGCTVNMECDDSNPCTNDTCQGGTCEHVNNTSVCSDGDACTTGDQCSGGSCVGGAALNCDDSNECTDVPACPRRDAPTRTTRRPATTATPARRARPAAEGPAPAGRT